MMHNQPTQIRRLLKLLTSFCDCAFGLVTLISLFAFAARFLWIAELLTQFRVQYLLILLPAAIAYFLFKRRRVGTLLSVGVAANLLPIFLYSLSNPMSRENPGSTGLRVMEFNVFAENSNYDEVLDYVRSEDPDIFVAIETNNAWIAHLMPLTKQLPFYKSTQDRERSGIAIFSRIAFDELELRHDPKFQNPSIHAVVTHDKRQIQLIAAHASTPMSPDGLVTRNGQLRKLSGELNQKMSRIFFGDFNMTPWSPYFSDILNQSDLVTTDQTFVPQPTWYPDHLLTRMLGPLQTTWLGGLKIDHILVSPDIQIADHRVGPDLGSDHRPVIVDLK